MSFCKERNVSYSSQSYKYKFCFFVNGGNMTKTIVKPFFTFTITLTINLNILHNMKFIYLISFCFLFLSLFIRKCWQVFGNCPFSAGAGAGFVSRVTRKEVWQAVVENHHNQLTTLPVSCHYGCTFNLLSPMQCSLVLFKNSFFGNAGFFCVHIVFSYLMLPGHK